MHRWVVLSCQSYRIRTQKPSCRPGPAPVYKDMDGGSVNTNLSTHPLRSWRGGCCLPGRRCPGLPGVVVAGLSVHPEDGDVLEALGALAQEINGQDGVASCSSFNPPNLVQEDGREGPGIHLQRGYRRLLTKTNWPLKGKLQ
jgi:hypothetical protein